MKILKYCLLLLLTLTGLLSVRAQTAEEIISKHINAIGGKEKINQIKSVYTEGTVAVMGTDGQRKTFLLVGKGYRAESDFGQLVIQGFTDKSGWTINPFSGGPDAQAMSGKEFNAGRDLIYVDGTLSRYSERGGKVELIGRENVGTVSAYKIKETDPDSVSTVFYIDPATYYVLEIVKSGSLNGQDVTITITLSDFRKTPIGYTAPFKVETKVGDQIDLVETIVKMEFDKELDPKIFEMPK
jgi:hypothetical protein